MKNWFLSGCLLLSLISNAHATDDFVRRMKPSIVSLSIETRYGLGREISGSNVGTGFIVDTEKALIVTAQQLTRSAPVSKCRVKIFNRETVDCRVVYYDAWHDFSILEYDKNALNTSVKAIPLGTHADVKTAPEVFLISYDWSHGYMTMVRNVRQLFSDFFNHDRGRHSHHFETSGIKTNATIGTPVITSEGKVVGLHTGFSNESSMELRIEYVADVLRDLRRGRNPRRGDLNVDLESWGVSEARNYLKYPDMKTLSAGHSHLSKVPKGLERVLVVQKLLEGSIAKKVLRNGDIVLGIKSKKDTSFEYLGDNLYRFDRIVDLNVEGAVTILILRNGNILQVDVPVEDAELTKPREFVFYRGTIFQNVTTDIALSLNVNKSGIFISESAPGSEFGHIGNTRRSSTRSKNVILYELKGKKIETLSELMSALGQLQPGKGINLIARDLRSESAASEIRFVDIGRREDVVRHFKWDSSQNQWMLVR